MTLSELEAAIEAVLFAAGEAVEILQLAEAIEQDTATAKVITRNLMDKLEAENRGIEIVEIGDSFQLRTRSQYYGYISRLYSNAKPKPLSPSLVETLAIIAYRQPITKGQIEEIRGVNADHAVNRLVELGLVCEMGRLDAPGRPILFGTTDDFLRHYGFKNLEALPDLPADEEDEQLRLEAEQEADSILSKQGKEQ